MNDSHLQSCSNSSVLLVGHGYVGSALRSALDRAGYSPVVCDQNPLAVEGMENAVCCRYQELGVDDLAPFGVIIWMAGHSSVLQATQDPDGAIANNCFDLLALARRKRAETRLIYASTASLYSVSSGSTPTPPPLLDETETRLNPENAYDASKMAFDALAKGYAEGLTGLRLGTVSGYGSCLRAELVFNAMNISALEDGSVHLANPFAFRSLLFLDDLERCVLALLERKEPLPSIVNVASLNVRLGQLAEQVAGHYGVPVIERTADAPTYSFQMNCDLAERLCGPGRNANLATRCEEFAAAVVARA